MSIKKSDQERRDEALRMAEAKVFMMTPEQLARPIEFPPWSPPPRALPPKREAATHLLDDCPCPRPCCHTTGPNHHPACQEAK